MSYLNYFPTPVWRVLLLRAGSYAGDENLRSPDSADRIRNRDCALTRPFRLPFGETCQCANVRFNVNVRS